MAPKLDRFLQKITLSQELATAGFIIVLTLLGLVFAYDQIRIASLSRQVADLSTATELLQSTLNSATTSIKDAFQEERARLQSQIGGVEDKVGSISGTVTTLQKLSEIDPELLKKYSKVFFLSDNYVPVGLLDIPQAYRYNEKKDSQVIAQVMPHLTAMLDAAKADGVALYVDSAYRSFNTQESLKEQYRITYGAGTANQFSADQGYSEHQLGTTVDFITTGLGGLLVGFDRTPAYAWLLDNAYRYGFILSYPKNNGYYMFEPWHWRFVGVKLATDLHASGSYFYSMEQRTLDTYLVSIFD